VRPAGCWVLKETRVAIEQTSGRQRLNIHGALDLETGNTRMIEVDTVDANSTIALLSALEMLYPKKKTTHVFLDNARYHHARLVQAWLNRPDCRIKLHFLPPYCPHLDPIERLWGLAHKHVTHNKCYASFKEFAAAFLTFLREDVPKNAPLSAIPSPTTSASLIPGIFGYSGERGISNNLLNMLFLTPQYSHYDPALR
jgi:transposase